MGPRLAILFSIGALALLPSLPVQAAEKGSMAYASVSQPATKSQTTEPTLIQGQRNVLEMVADQLDLSNEQQSELQNLLQRQQEQVAALHEDLTSSDAEKSAKFHQIRQQTKQQFVAVLTRDQKREFNRIMGQ